MSSSYYGVNDFETRSCCDAAAGAVQIVLTVQRGRPAWPLAPLRSAQRCWQCRRVFSLVCSNAAVRSVLLFQNICYSAVRRDLPFHTLVIFFPPFCVLFV